MRGSITTAPVKPNNSAQGRELKETSPVNKSGNQKQEMSALGYLQRQHSLSSQVKEIAEQKKKGGG